VNVQNWHRRQESNPLALVLEARPRPRARRSLEPTDGLEPP